MRDRRRVRRRMGGKEGNNNKNNNRKLFRNPDAAAVIVAVHVRQTDLCCFAVTFSPNAQQSAQQVIRDLQFGKDVRQ